MTELVMLSVALALDLAFGEPPAALHPVVWMGKLATWLERLAPRGNVPRLAYGALMVILGMAAFVLPVQLLIVYLRDTSPVAYFLFGSFLLKTTFSVKGLFHAAEEVRLPLVEGRLEKARSRLRGLVSRDTTSLSESQISASVVESVAENSSDSFVAPLFFYALFGLPGALAYRLLNTLDAMIGYHGPYEHLGKVAARLDDCMNFIPARLTGLLLVAAGVLLGKGGGSAWRTMCRFHGVTESPNAGWPMSAMAGALGVQLEKVGHYRLGDGAESPAPLTIAQAENLARVAMFLAAVGHVALVLLRHAN
ncbi:MAG: cobalamin biosynthesis protein [Armatimonadetes bacterium]|nr:cobalamin biosynthesis protein [Armatimonadota bacterium]